MPVLGDKVVSTDLVTQGRALLASRDWAGARDVFMRVLDSGEDPRALEGLGWTAFWTGDADLLFRSRERAYALYRESGDPVSAARMAIWLGCDYHDVRGEHAIAQGWHARARRLLEDAGPVPEYGWLVFQEGAYAIELEDDTETAKRMAQEAVAVGRSLGVLDLETTGLALEGLALVTEGSIERGMRCLDEAAVAATGGELTEHAAATWTLCYLIYACERVRDHDRAAQWCKKMQEVSARLSFDLGVGICRAHYAGVLILHGAWSDAEEELVRARSELVQSGRIPVTAEVDARLGELRRRQGRTTEAAGLFEPARPHPMAMLGLAALAIGNGDAAGAADTLEHLLSMIPLRSRTQRADALELLTVARIALQDHAGASEAASELAAIAESVATKPLHAMAAASRARVDLASGDPLGARRRFEASVDLYERSGLPYEAATTRLELAHAFEALGHGDAAARESGLAAARLRELGASTTEAADRQGAGTAGLLSAREVEVLRLVCDGLSDREIGSRLSISPHTVHRHVSNILTKLGLPSRAAAAAQAAKLGIT